MNERTKRTRLILVVSLLLVASGTAAAGEMPQVAADDYERAERWMGSGPASYVKNLLPIPRWTKDGEEFWYLKETADGDEFILVDASSGDTRRAFDQEWSLSWRRTPCG